MRPEVGQIINGKYRLTRLIGEGGMGSVFEATHEYLGSAVALKFLNPILAERHGLVARFLQEARVSASIRSPHVVQVSDVDQTAGGLPYLVMELLEGESLQQVLNRMKKLPIGASLEYAVQILNGLEVAHARSIVHRDLKPDNVFVVSTPNGPLLKLLDFGIAKLRTIAELQPGLTRPGAMMGTLEYMAPEQAFSADTVDHRADLFAVGVILFEMIAGMRPVEVDEPHAMAAMIMAGHVKRLSDVVPSVPQGLSDVVARALAGRATDRFGSAAEMRGSILPFFTASPQAAGVRGYPSAVVATPPVPPVQAGTAVVSAPGADRPAPTQPGDDPEPGGVSPTLPPSEPPQEGRTGTVLGDGLGPEMPAGQGDYGATEEMRPMQFEGAAPPPPAYSSPPPKKKSSAWTIIGVLAAFLGALAAAAIIAFFFVIDADDPDPPIAVPTIGPPTTVTADNTAIGTPTATAPGTTAPTSTSPPTTTSPTATTTARPPRRDGGAPDAGWVIPGLPDGGLGLPKIPDGGLPMPPFPSSLPSNLPPIQMPSGIPTFPIPGWPPPPPPPNQ
ncbi:MAG: serine/threonine-protein kinase [Myxococcota bacterium]